MGNGQFVKDVFYRTGQMEGHVDIIWDRRGFWSGEFGAGQCLQGKRGWTKKTK